MRRRTVSIITTLTAVLFAAQPAVTDDLMNVVDSSARLISGFTLTESSRLYNERRVSRFYFEKPYTRYLLDSPFSETIIRQIGEIGPNIGVETVYLFSAPGVSPDHETMLRLYNLVRKVSTLEGIEYYSSSREKMRTFFSEFYSIDSPESKNRIDDVQVNSIPETDTAYAFQKDLTFGESISRIVFRGEGSQIALSITNLTPLRYMLIPLIGEENMQINIVIQVFDDYVLFYGNCSVRTLDLFGIAERKKESFSTRIDALYNWFTTRYGSQS